MDQTQLENTLVSFIESRHRRSSIKESKIKNETVFFCKPSGIPRKHFLFYKPVRLFEN